MKKPQPKDQAQRTRAILEREHNVIVDAGAGTGKTTLLVARLLHLIAPEDDGPCFPIDRVAAVTFTRKAAGELKLRLRQTLLTASARSDLSTARAQRLRHAIELLDNAPIGTVHSFADRLLRLRPADAHVSPQYEIAEDAEELVWETHRWLLEAAEHGSFSAALAGTDAEPLADEAAETLRLFQTAGFLTQTEEFEHFSKMGLSSLVQDLISSRDRDLKVPELAEPDLARVRTVVDELGRVVSDLTGQNGGTKTLRRLLKLGQAIAQSANHAEALGHARTFSLECRSAKLQQKHDFPDDKAGWQAWKWLSEGTRGAGKAKEERPGGPLAEELTAPLMTWMATRLVRLRPVVLTRYLQVKRAHQVLDQVDLLIELRDLLRRDLSARAFYQSRFDHILVDEFQDTDPLQAEILMFLCEQGAQAKGLADLTIASGKLTIVGDPKQSIYRFRRADIAMYAEVCDRVRQGPVCEVELSVNFRSTPELIDWINTGFDAVLGAAESGPLYDKNTGAVRNLRLSTGRKKLGVPSVHVLPFGDAEMLADESRNLEGEALARYLRWLVEDSDVQIADPHTGALRRPRYGDMAVLMVATQTVHHLLSELDLVRIPHVVRGGTLFMRDTLHQQFVLGLRALSDPDDGVAQAALLRPPFFALGMDDLVRDRFKREGEPSSEPLQQARAIVTQLRRDRHQRPAGETARRVLEQTGFGRFVAASENGAQRLARLYELCLTLDGRARSEGLDFDGMTEVARGWLDSPIRLEAPLPVDADAVQVITVHQAKGLEWPVVALWDGRASWQAYLPIPALSVDASSGEWAMQLDGLSYDTSGRGIRDREIALRKQERKRVAYVATTRARDILIVPEAGAPKMASMAGALLLHTVSQKEHRIDTYEGEGRAWWDTKTGVSMRPVAPLREDLDGSWRKAATLASEPRLVPAGVSTVTHGRSAEASEEEERPPRKERKGRYGPTFGTTVHRALELVLTKRVGEVEKAVEQAAREAGLTVHLDVAVTDVVRTLATLKAEGLMSSTMRLEYPIAGSLDPSTLLLGYVDLLIATAEGLVLIDFKTDTPPPADEPGWYAAYVAQVRTYVALLAPAGVTGARPVKAGLLFTGDGGLRWV